MCPDTFPQSRAFPSRLAASGLSPLPPVSSFLEAHFLQPVGCPSLSPLSLVATTETFSRFFVWLQSPVPGELSGTVAACAASISSPPLGFVAGRVSRPFTAGSLDGSTHRQNPQLPCDPQSPKITVTDVVFFCFAFFENSRRVSGHVGWGWCGVYNFPPASSPYTHESNTVNGIP